MKKVNWIFKVTDESSLISENDQPSFRKHWPLTQGRGMQSSSSDLCVVQQRDWAGKEVSRARSKVDR